MRRRTIHQGAVMGLALLAICSAVGVAVAAETAPPGAALKGECIETGLVKPGVVHPMTMSYAGIRPLTPGRRRFQGTAGVLHFGAMPESCSPSVTRSMDGKIEMQLFNRPSVWANVAARNGISWQPGNKEGGVRVFGGPNHAWPDYWFNECRRGHWLKVRTIIMTRVRDGVTHELLGERSYVFPVRVHGSCAEAKRSKRLTANYKEEWGDGSGSLRPGLMSSNTQKLGIVRPAHPPTSCQSTDSASQSPQWRMRSFFTKPSVRPGGTARFVTAVAGGNLATFSLEVDAVYKPQRDVEVLARGSRPAWIRTGGNPHWALEDLCHWKDKRRISFLVAVDRQAPAGRLCIPYIVDGRTGYADQPNSYDVSGTERNCLRVER
jgi:hypothetical protein